MPMPMTLPELYVMRHGETEWNRLGRWQGPHDSPLTETGEAQARDLGALLRARGVLAPGAFDILTSPQGRAVRTAELAFGPGAARPDDRLREIGVGDWAGRDRAVIRAEAALPEDAHFLDLYAAAPGGEPFADLYARVQDLLRDLVRPSVIVTHGITSRFLRSAALGHGLDALDVVPGGQGVVHHLRGGEATILRP